MIDTVKENTTDTPSRDATINELASQLGVRAERGRRFAELTSLRVGGAIDWVLSPPDEKSAAALVHELDQREIAWRPLGSGSNVLAVTTSNDSVLKANLTGSAFPGTYSLQVLAFAVCGAHIWLLIFLIEVLYINQYRGQICLISPILHSYYVLLGL